VLGTAAYYFRRRIRALFDRKPASETAACTADQTRESENAA
jgi:hypothetical protein